MLVDFFLTHSYRYILGRSTKHCIDHDAFYCMKIILFFNDLRQRDLFLMYNTYFFKKTNHKQLCSNHDGSSICLFMPSITIKPRARVHICAMERWRSIMICFFFVSRTNALTYTRNAAKNSTYDMLGWFSVVNFFRQVINGIEIDCRDAIFLVCYGKNTFDFEDRSNFWRHISAIFAAFVFFKKCAFIAGNHMLTFQIALICIYCLNTAIVLHVITHTLTAIRLPRILTIYCHGGTRMCFALLFCDPN